MDSSDIKRIEAVTARETKWVSEHQLIFKIADESSFDIISYLGEGPTCHISLTFAKPVNLATGNSVEIFKIQAAEQGIQLTCVGSYKNAISKSGIFIRMACNRRPLYKPKKCKSDDDRCLAA
jgi:hypothetical protein